MLLDYWLQKVVAIDFVAVVVVVAINGDGRDGPTAQ